MDCKLVFGPGKQLWVELEGAASPPEVLLRGSALLWFSVS